MNILKTLINPFNYSRIFNEGDLHIGAAQFGELINLSFKIVIKFHSLIRVASVILVFMISIHYILAKGE